MGLKVGFVGDVGEISAVTASERVVVLLSKFFRLSQLSWPFLPSCSFTLAFPQPLDLDLTLLGFTPHSSFASRPGEVTAV